MADEVLDRFNDTYFPGWRQREAQRRPKFAGLTPEADVEKRKFWEADGWKEVDPLLLAGAADLRRQLEEARRLVRDMQELLVRNEFCHDETCPSCNEDRMDGHSDGCIWAATIARAREATK